MQTTFAPERLTADSDLRTSEQVLRKCVHCGFCTATCPTYVLLGDELDSPRGRIYLIKDMLEGGKPATAETVKHVDRCLSCLSCMSTCPSGVHYMHLVDHARHYIEATYKRPLADRLMRRLLGAVLPRPLVFRFALIGASLMRPVRRWLPSKLQALVALAPAAVPGPSPFDRVGVAVRAEGERKRRVALLAGCAQRVLAPEINAATLRLLSRHGCEVVIPRAAGCCGALTHHLGQDSLAFAKANIDAWLRERDAGGLDAIVINASGCGTTVKDYGHMLRDDPAYAEKARLVSSLARDVTELMSELGLSLPSAPSGLRVAYHAACSMQHGQGIKEPPRLLLKAAGFDVAEVPEGHLCCGSAGTYNLLQPEIAGQLRDRKVANIEGTRPAVIATGNIGCMTQIASGTSIPVVHTAQLLDWATGGPPPEALRR